jgi:ABC-type antimicrobial peptide transport system permease subunit
VAREIILPTLETTDSAEFYQLLRKGEPYVVYLSMRCRGNCPDEAAIRARIQSAHRGIRVRAASPAEDQYLVHQRLPKAIAGIGGLFALVGMLTAAAGLFAVLVHAVARRRRELGIRIALGASPQQLRRLVLGDGMRVTFVGAGIGALGGWVISRSLAAFHYGVTAADPLAWIGVLGAIGLASLAAAWHPARQAMRVDPARLLREE